MNNQQAQNLGDILKARRSELELSTYQVAAAAGIDQATVVRLENGAFTAPHPDKLARVAEGLNLSAADLFAVAGYTTPNELPDLGPYLRVKYCDLPEEDLERIEVFVAKVVKKISAASHRDAVPASS